MFKLTHLLVLMTGLLISCMPSLKVTPGSRIQDGYYDSEFSRLPVSGYLEKIWPSVRMVSGMTSYRAYQFDYSEGVTSKNVSDYVLRLGDEKSFILDRPNYGTATIIYNDGKKMALLTCAHVVSKPDTQVTYFADEEGRRTNYIQSIHYRISQRYTVVGYSRTAELEVLAVDQHNDLAVVAGPVDSEFLPEKIPTLPAVWGDMDALQWGSLVYIFGYPGGKKMINQALVSLTEERDKNIFLVDKAISRGISGGLVLALRDGLPNFEIVGLIKSVPVKRQTVLLPEKPINGELVEMADIYEGPIYMGLFSAQIPSMSIAVDIEAIRNFLQGAEDELHRHGIFIDLNK